MSVSRIAEVSAVEADGNVKCDLGGDDALIADHFADGGDDCPPLAGDFVALDDGPGTGTKQATGYHDPSDVTARQAAPGEKRIYSRAGPGVLAATLWLKADGTIVIQSELAPAGGTFEIGVDGVVTINGDAQIDATGEVIAKVSGGGVKLSTHLTPSPFGPLGPPTPGT